MLPGLNDAAVRRCPSRCSAAPSAVLMYASPYTRMLAAPVRLIVSVLPLHVAAAAEQDDRLRVARRRSATPSPMSFRNVPVRLYTYTAPFESAVSVIVTVIDVGVPLQCGVAVGEQVTVTLCTFDATTLSLTSTPFWHSRRISLFDAEHVVDDVGRRRRPSSAAVVLQVNCTTSVPPATGGLASAHDVVVGERDLGTARVARVADDVGRRDPRVARARQALVHRTCVPFRIPTNAMPSAPTMIASITIATSTSTSVNPASSRVGSRSAGSLVAPRLDADAGRTRRVVEDHVRAQHRLAVGARRARSGDRAHQEHVVALPGDD